MKWGRWWGVWVPWFSRLRWHLVSKVDPSSIPAGENHLQLWSPDGEAGEGGYPEEFTPGLSLGEQPHLLPPQKPCLWWTVLMSPHLLWKWESCSSEFYVFSGAGLVASSWQGDGPGIHLYHPCEHPASKLTASWGWVGTPTGGAEKSFLIWSRSSVCVRVAFISANL